MASSSGKRHAWESDSEYDAAGAVEHHAWEEPDEPEGGWGENPDGEAEPGPSPQACAVDYFLELLMSLYYNSTLSAQTVCLLCYYAGVAGLPEEVAQYGRRPGTSCSHCARHLQKKLGVWGHSRQAVQA